MRIAVMQPYFFPYIGYWQLINEVDKFIVFDDVNYIKRGWINRNYILTNKTKQLFTIPLIGASQNKLINQISVAEGTGWKSKFLKTVRLAYKKAPQFDQAYPIIKRIILNPSVNLSAYVTNCILKICCFLDIRTEIVPGSEQYATNDLKGQDKILKICKMENADTYLNLSGGVKLYDKSLFKEHSISLQFIRTKIKSYDQFGGHFEPNLSIIDILMFNTISEIKKMLTKYEIYE